ncbi:transporter substrate-binding domain-containing protein [Stenotrophomonas indicatrix]|uniref:response regulator n=1 Tax=Stenotrophomonas indicatrix TaxID=2045451 RepID=UPI00300BA4F3
MTLLIAVAAVARSSTIAIAQTSTESLVLEQASRDWLSTRSELRLGVVGNWPPFEQIQDNRLSGLGLELLQELAQQLQVSIAVRRFSDWPQLYRAACAGEVDVIANVSLSARRTRCLVFTEPYVQAPMALVGRPHDSRLLADPELVGVRLVSDRGTATIQLARERYPEAVHLDAADAASALALVASDQADAYLGQAHTAHQLMEKAGYTHLVLVRPADQPYDLLHYAVPNQAQPLAIALDAALASLSPDRRSAIERQWLGRLPWAHRGQLGFTADERQVLARPLRAGWVSGHAPLSFLDLHGRPAGLAAEYLHRLRAHGAHLPPPVLAQSWQELAAQAASGQIDVLVGVPRDVSWLGPDWQFSQSFADIPNIIVTASSASLKHLGELSGLRVAVCDLGRVGPRIRAAAPLAQLVEVASPAEGMRALDQGKVDAYVGNLAVVNHQINELYSGRLRVAAPTGFNDELSIAVRRQHSALLSAFDRIVAQMSPQERQAIRSSWLAVEYRHGIHWPTLWRWLGPTLLILLTAIAVQAWNQRRLRREVRQRRLTERSLAQARAAAERSAAAKSEFLATMSHEIRTPMTGILGMLEVLDLSPLNATQRHTLNLLTESANMLRRILDGILDVSRLEAGALELDLATVDLVTLVRRVAMQFERQAESQGLELELQLDSRLQPALLADELRLRQILFNLLSNALKFTQSGSVGIQLAVLEDSSFGQRLRLSVWDTGIGMSPEQCERVQAPFVQANASIAKHYGGTGLGLAIVGGLAHLMQAKLTLNSSPGVGTEVCLEWWAPMGEGATAVPLPVPSLAPGQRLAQILVAEDHPISQQLMRWRLQYLGLACVIVEDGEQALKVWRGQNFDLLLTDCRMPNCDGFELTRAIRSQEALDRRPRMTIVAMTAGAQLDVVQQCIQAGMDEVLSKPVALHELAQVLIRHLPVATEDSEKLVEAAAEPPQCQAQAGAPNVLGESNASGAKAAWRRLQRAFDEPGVARTLLQTLITTASSDLAVLRSALDADDRQRAVEALHRIAGGFGMLDMNNVAEPGLAWERLVAGDSSVSMQGVQAYAQTVERWLDALQAEIDC